MDHYFVRIRLCLGYEYFDRAEFIFLSSIDKGEEENIIAGDHQVDGWLRPPQKGVIRHW